MSSNCRSDFFFGFCAAAPAFGWLCGRLGTLRAALVAGLLVLPGWLVHQWIVGTVPSRGGGRGLRDQTVFGLGSWFADRHPFPVLDYVRVSPTGPMIPLAMNVTTLGDVKEGDVVNVEADVVAKYVKRSVSPWKADGRKERDER